MMRPDPRPEEILYVCAHMREKSRQEILGMWDGGVEQFGDFLTATEGFKWVGYAEGRPAALIGAYPLHRGVWGLFGLGTEDWTLIWREVTSVARRDMLRAVTETGAHRAECITRADHDDTHRWLKLLGAKHKVDLPRYGSDGSDYVMFAWLKD